MTLFTQHEHRLLYDLNESSHQPNPALEAVYRRLFDLQQAVNQSIKKSQLELHRGKPALDAVEVGSVSSLAPEKALSVGFSRSEELSLTVQRVLGRDVVDAALKPRLHPVIELRLTPDHFVVELIVAPEARQDQENFAGKISIDQHRRQLYKMLKHYDTNYCIGFWAGTHLDDMHLTTTKLPPPQIFFEYLETFAVNRDYLRIGCWYAPEELDAQNAKSEIMARIKELYNVYQFALWSSNNNFVEFFRKGVKVK